MKIAALCLMISLGWFQPANAADAPETTGVPPVIVPEKKILIAPPAAPAKMYEYKVMECGSGNTNNVADCLNSMARQGWRVHAPWGSSFVIFER